MELTYSLCGDYLIPNLALEDTKEYHIGKYGRMCRAYLKDHRPALYSSLLLTEKLLPHLAEIDAACQAQLKTIEAAMMRQEGVTEAFEGRRSDGVGTPDEQHPQPGRGSCPA